MQVTNEHDEASGGALSNLLELTAQDLWFWAFGFSVWRAEGALKATVKGGQARWWGFKDLLVVF